MFLLLLHSERTSITTILGVRGVGHMEELAYLWDTRIVPDEGPDDPADVVVRHQLLTLWSNFVKYL